MTLYNRGSARRSLIDTVAFRAISQISTFLGYVVLVRGIPEDDFGVFSLLYAFIPVVSAVASFGLEPVLRRFQPEYLQAGNRVASAWLVKIVASSRLITNIVLLALIVLGWNYIAPVINLAPHHRYVFASFSLLILLYFQTSILQVALGSHMLHRYSVGSTAVLSIIKLVAYGVLFELDALSLQTAIIADTLAYAAAYGAMRVVYNRKCVAADSATTYRPDPVERKRLIRYALLNNFNDAGVLLLYSTVDSFFIAAFVSTTAVGIYAFYTRLKLMVSNVLPIRVFENVIRPLFLRSSCRCEPQDASVFLVSPQYEFAAAMASLGLFDRVSRRDR